MDSKYKNPDNDSTPWRNSDAFAPSAATHQGMVYAIQHPITGKMLYPSNGRCWPYAQDEMLSIMRGWCDYELKNLEDDEARAIVCGVPVNEARQGVMGITLSDSLEISSAKAREVYNRGQWPRFFFTKGGKGGIAKKTYLENVGGKLATNLWLHTEVGHTDEAKKEMLAIFSGRAPFDTPKPSRLLEFVLRIAADENSIILDSFAGSGTTAHAVLKMNKQDGGHRKFILVEMMDYAETITAERVRRVINGYGSVEGTGGSFSFYDLGETLLNGDQTINEAVPTRNAPWPALVISRRPRSVLACAVNDSG
jgi:adenine-specific DNA-methyltransferase